MTGGGGKAIEAEKGRGGGGEEVYRPEKSGLSRASVPANIRCTVENRRGPSLIVRETH